MSGSNKKPAKAADRRAVLTEHLMELLNDIDDEGLEHIMGQAEVLVQAKKMREDRRKLGESLERLGSGGKVNVPVSEPSVEVVENPSGNSFVIVMNNERNFMPLDEMRKIVSVAHLAVDEADGAKRLATWFTRYRPEVIRNSGLTGPKDPHLFLLYRHLVENYTVKE